MSMDGQILDEREAEGITDETAILRYSLGTDQNPNQPEQGNECC